jgi:hypothetical protein
MLLWGSSTEKISLPLTRLSLFSERGLYAKPQFIGYCAASAGREFNMTAEGT